MKKKIEEEILSLASSIKEEEKEIKGKKESDSIQDIKYIDKALKIDGKAEAILCIVFDKGEGSTSKRYYIAGELVCILDDDISDELIFTDNREKTHDIDLEKLRVLIQNPEKFGKEEISISAELATNDKLVEKIAKELGISKEDVKVMGILDPEQEIEEKDKDKKEEKKKKGNEEKKQEEQEENLEEKKVYAKDLNIKQNVKSNTKVNEMQTLAQFMKLPPECSRIAVIETDDMYKVTGEKGSKTRYSFVAINKDGTVKEIEGLEQDMSIGNTAMQDNYRVMHDGDVERSKVTSRYTINGTNASLSVRKNEGQLEVFMSPDKTRDGNESLDKQLETDNVWPIRKEVKDIAGYYSKDGVRAVDEVVDRAEKTNVEDKDTSEFKDIDEHGETESETIREIGPDDEIKYGRGTITLREYARRNGYDDLNEILTMFREADGTDEERLEQVDDQINEQFKGSDRKR